MAERQVVEQDVVDVESGEESEGVTHKVVEATVFGVTKAALVTGSGTKTAAVATGKGAKVATLATGRFLRGLGKGVKTGAIEGVAKAKGVLDDEDDEV